MEALKLRKDMSKPGRFGRFSIRWSIQFPVGSFPSERV